MPLLTHEEVWVFFDSQLALWHLDVHLMAQGLLERELEACFSAASQAAEAWPHRRDVGPFQGVVLLDQLPCIVDLQ